jgi:hypothetical protein
MVSHPQVKVKVFLEVVYKVLYYLTCTSVFMPASFPLHSVLPNSTTLAACFVDFLNSFRALLKTYLLSQTCSSHCLELQFLTIIFPFSCFMILLHIYYQLADYDTLFIYFL